LVPGSRETPVAEIPRPDEKEGTIVAFLGDSLTAGLGLPESEAYPAVIGRTLESRGVRIRVINAGVSGDTSAGGLRRVDWLLAQKPDVLVVALGGNDGLRGLPVGEMESNLRQIVSKGKAAGTRVLLCGLKVPPNYPPSMAGEFEGVFPRIAKDEGVALVPFLLEGVGGRPELNQPDGIHPNAMGQEILAKNVLTGLEAVLVP
jgi:acyl-CoA thioesterase-1